MKALLLTVALLLGCASVSSQEKDAGIITVSTDDLSMVFSISADKKVVYNYFGDAFADVSPFLTKKYKEQPDNGTGYAPAIYPAYGGRLSLNPALKLTHTDGVQTTELIYVDHQVNKIDDNRTETQIRMKDPLYPVSVTLSFTAYGKENVICQSAAISHGEKGKLAVENIASAYLPLHADAYYLTHFHGTWASEMQLVEEKLTPGVKRVESKKGVRTTQSENSSFLLSLNHPADEDRGEVYAGSLAWSGNYLSSFEIDECGLLHILSGMNDFASTYYLEPGETLQTPEMVWTYSSNGKGQASRNLHDWSRNYALAHGNRELPVVLNSWEGAYFDFSEKTITDMIDAAADFGVEMFVLDDGWFGNKYPRNSDKAGLGDWQVNKKKLPHGIDYLAKYAVDKGVKFGIWIEPEMVNPKSELAEKHPEWIVKSGQREIIPMRNQWLLDLSNPAVQDFVVKTFDDVIALSPHISYIKWDANRHVDNFGSDYLSEENQTHFWIEYTKGLYSAYERIRAKHPDILIQLCSSGGGRLDFGALKYHDEFWASDNTNSLDRVFIQYGTNLFFPAKATAAHVSTSPNHQTGMMAPLKFRFDVAMSGRLGMELQPKDLAGNELAFAKNAVKDYKRIRPLVQLGDLYRLKSPYDGNGWASHMYVSKDKKESVFFAYSLKYHGRTTFFETRLKGLNPDKMYRVVELNKAGHSTFYGDGRVFPGEYLMKAGINLTIGNPYESSVLLITEPSVSSGKWTVGYDEVQKGHRIEKEGRLLADGVYASYKLGDRWVTTRDYESNRSKATAVSDAFGDGTLLQVTYTDADLPTLVQSFYIYPEKDYLLTEFTLQGGEAGVESNYMAPVHIDRMPAVLEEGDNRALFQPFDNDCWIRYQSHPLTFDRLRSYEVATVFNNDNRKGFVVGSVEHSDWKTGIDMCKGDRHNIGSLVCFGGVADSLTRDSKAHGVLKGKEVKSPKIFFGIFDDWRTGLEEYGKANAVVAPVKRWPGAVTFGWNSWGALQFRLNHQNAVEVSDFFKEHLQDNHFVNADGKVTIGLDSGWNSFTEKELRDFVDHCTANGQIAGTYWTPFTDWGKHPERTIKDAPAYTYKDVYLYANGKPQELDGAYAIDPTHPAIEEMMKKTSDLFRRCGFKYVKMDFMTHGAMEADKWYRPEIQTGIQAYNYGMQLLNKYFGDMYINLSISPVFPAHYANSRRIACDAWNKIKDTEYTLNALSYGWWQDEVYQYNDPDHLVLREATEGENRARITSGAITGLYIIGDDFSKGGKQVDKDRALKFLTNPEVNAVAKGISFVPVEGNGEKSEHQFVRHDADGTTYFAIFNYSEEEMNTTIPLERIGLDPAVTYEAKELWSGNQQPVKVHLTLTVPAKDALLYKIGMAGAH